MGNYQDPGHPTRQPIERPLLDLDQVRLSRVRIANGLDPSLGLCMQMEISNAKSGTRIFTYTLSTAWHRLNIVIRTCS
jgi:aspartate 1-decarboxylase